MTAILEQISEEFILDLRSHPFLQRCRRGQASREEMSIFLAQQDLYSRHFTRFLCALMSNLCSNDQVHALAANLFEELGLDEAGAVPHRLIYKAMLADFGIEEPRAEAALPGTRRLVDVMYANCRDGDFARGLGALCLGAEALVPGMYGDVVAGFAALGDTGEKVAFFTIHIECDDGHAETMRAILEDLIRDDPDKAAVIEAAGREAVDARKAFFDSIEASASAAADRHSEWTSSPAFLQGLLCPSRPDLTALPLASPR